MSRVIEKKKQIQMELAKTVLGKKIDVPSAKGKEKTQTVELPSRRGPKNESFVNRIPQEGGLEPKEWGRVPRRRSEGKKKKFSLGRRKTPQGGGWHDVSKEGTIKAIGSWRGGKRLF